MLCAYFWLLPFCFFDSRHRRGCAKLGLCKEILPCIHTLKNIHVWYSTYVGPQILIETTRSTQVVWVLEVTCIYLHHFMWLPGAPKDGYLHTYIDLHHFMNLRDFLNFRSWQHQKRSNSARLPSKMDSWMQSWQPRTNAFCDFWTSKSGLNMLCFFKHFDLEMCFAPQQRALFRHHILSGPSMVCFVHFDLETCFTPKRRTLFRHLNFQKWSEHGVFCTFWLGHVLRATTACAFSIPKWSENGVFCTFCLRNVPRTTKVCNFSSLIFQDGSAPAALASLLFHPPEPQIIGNT